MRESGGDGDIPLSPAHNPWSDLTWIAPSLTRTSLGDCVVSVVLLVLLTS